MSDTGSCDTCASVLTIKMAFTAFPVIEVLIDPTLWISTNCIRFSPQAKVLLNTTMNERRELLSLTHLMIASFSRHNAATIRYAIANREVYVAISEGDVW